MNKQFDYDKKLKDKHIELLAPCGKKEMLIAAIASGADAVYLAGESYGARAFAENFNNDNLVEAVKLAHSYNVAVYVTVNTIIYENEIEEVLEYLDFLYLNDVDAVIVQDLGLASLIKTRYPDLRLHASTQMNLQTVADVKVAKQLGFDRVILGREVSLDTIKEIKKNVDIELEVFIHGALCISYSGNCFFSSLSGGRSGNRGRCAQPCRLSHVFNNKESFFLSPKDLCTIDSIKEIATYVDSLKIEGRMKSKEYVSRAVSEYRKALNSLPYDKFKLRLSFNRDYTKGFILNEDNNNFTNTLKSNHQGVLIGKVISTRNEKASILLTNTLKMNDSIRLVSKGKEDAITINAMYKNSTSSNSLVKEAKASEIVTVKLHKEMDENTLVYLTKREEDYVLSNTISITGKGYVENSSFCFVVTDGKNQVIEKVTYQDSSNNNEQRIKEQLNKVGNTIFNFKDLKITAPNIYIPVSIINELRRKVLNKLLQLRERWHNKREVNDVEPNLILDMENIPTSSISVAFSKKEQIEYRSWVNNIYYRNKQLFLSIKENNNYSNYNNNNNYSNYYYLPRVHYNEYKETNVVSSSLGSLGDISSPYCNVTNSYTVRVLETLGVKRIGLSIELSRSDMELLITSYEERYHHLPNVEVMIYGYYQLMYMRHCFINKEFGYKNNHCGKCKEGMLFDDRYPVFGDEECHLALLYREPVNLIPKLKELKDMGVRNFLLDFTIENNTEVQKIFDDYLNHTLPEGYFGMYNKNIE